MTTVGRSIVPTKAICLAPLVAAKKRKLFEKAQLKRQYAKLLKKEAATARGEHGPGGPRSDGAADAGKERRADGLVLTPNRKRKEEAGGGELKRRREHSDDRESGERQQVAEGRKQKQRKPGKWRRPEHRPDPFKTAKVKRHCERHPIACHEVGKYYLLNQNLPQISR